MSLIGKEPEIPCAAANTENPFIPVRETELCFTKEERPALSSAERKQLPAAAPLSVMKSVASVRNAQAQS